ncbi:MAG: type III pantothenate kinase [Brevinema sp.]
MTTAFDIGNTNVKVFLIDKDGTVVSKKTRPTPDLFEPQAWYEFLEVLKESHEGFRNSKMRISCVNWRVFLALRVVFGYTPAEEFDTDVPFDPALMELPDDSPFVLEQMIPLERPSVPGLIGTDRLLSAFALYDMYKESFFVVSLGTATTIDLVTGEGIFYGGVICPGLDSSYAGLLSRAPHLPAMTELPSPDKIVGTNTLQALSAGSIIAHAVMIDGFIARMRRDAGLAGPVNIVLTGGRAFTISPYMRSPHTVQEHLVALGLTYLDHAEPLEIKALSNLLAHEPPVPVDDKSYKIPPEPIMSSDELPGRTKVFSDKAFRVRISDDIALPEEEMLEE